MKAKKVRYRGKVMDLYDLCSMIDRIHYSYAVIYSNYNSYDECRSLLYKVVSHYRPSMLPDFKNLYITY